MTGEIYYTDFKPGDMIKLVARHHANIWFKWSDISALSGDEKANRGDWALVINLSDLKTYAYVLVHGQLGWIVSSGWMRMNA